MKAEGAAESIQASAPYVVLTGNPNSGKTTLFNALTGLRAKVGNYAGVTVERKEGRLLHAPSEVKVIDLPGTYSLSPQSLDEQISRDVLLHRLPELPAPSLVVVVVDASNLQRNLYYATQVVELGYPTIIALNMIDVAEANGHQIDLGKLSSSLGVPVLALVASNGKGVPELRTRIIETLKLSDAGAPLKQFYLLPPAFVREAGIIAALLNAHFRERRRQAAAEALLILSNEKALASSLEHYPAPIQQAVDASRKRLEAAGVDWRGAAIEARYTSIAEIQGQAVTETRREGESFSDKLDRVVTHRLWGTLIFVAVMALMFQSIFTFAQVPMDLLKNIVGWVGEAVGSAIPPGDLHSLVVKGAVAGVGAVVSFLPQILLLFLFIGLLEDTGYMARAAFLMDRLMSKVGLHGKSFIPMLSSFACAIPGIMATRTIESPKDRLVTILVAPLMSCSARLPVYTLLIGACIPNIAVLSIGGINIVTLAGLTMLAMYLLGIVMALLMAWLFKKTLLKGETPMLIMELPPYKRPLLRVVLRHMWDRSRMFLRRAGTVILGINILLWFLATYPHNAQRDAKFDANNFAAAKALFPDSTNAEATIKGLEGQFKAYADTEDKIDSLDSKKDAAEIASLKTNLPETDPKYQLYQRINTNEIARASEALRSSFAGTAGRAIEPIIKPLGFDWKKGIGIISSFAAREVFVSTMATVYSVGNSESDAGMANLQRTLQGEKEADGTPAYTALKAVTLMVFYVLAMQCVSTVAVVRRETNTWKWPVFQWIYMGLLAWGLAFVTFHGGHLLGFR